MIQLLKKILPKNFTFVLTDEHKSCLELLEHSDTHLFITGKAGTGKTSLIHYFRNNTKKKVVVLAPTGIAALNIKGQTIHSFFKFPPPMIDPKALKPVMQDRIYKDIDCIVIDEISMVRADILDGIDAFLRLNGRDKHLPFGGVQMVFVGDLYQLPPVVTSEELVVFREKYDSPYFFSSEVFQQMDVKTIELTTIFRQKEQEFVDVLNLIRVGEVSPQSLQLINNRSFLKYDDHIVLCTTNKVAEGINTSKLLTIKKPLHTYSAEIEGIFPTEERNLPVDLQLQLKEGAKVLFVKNDLEGQWVNGSTGVVDEITEDVIIVRLDGSGKLVEVGQDVWENIKYSLDEKTGEIKSEVVGKLYQYPIKLAWAITIHKSQGMTFDKVCLDFSKSPFAHGQTYVALSRCRTLEGLVLTRKIWPNDVLIDEKIRQFYQTFQKSEDSS